MTKDELDNEYFKWMYQQLVKPSYGSYKILLCQLHGINFYNLIDMDADRAEDGINLRYRFGYENGYESAMITSCLDNRPCSVLEMMVALAIKIEEQIMDDPDIGNRTGLWFWKMIENLGLKNMHDAVIDTDYVEEIIFRFLDRNYQRDGSGGLFIVHGHGDLRNVEIWYQMLWYLNDIL